jgi:hypothetical protein
MGSVKATVVSVELLQRSVPPILEYLSHQKFVPELDESQLPRRTQSGVQLLEVLVTEGFRNVSGILELPNCTVVDCESEFPEIEKGVEIPLAPRQPSKETEFSAVLGNGLDFFSQAV